MSPANCTAPAIAPRARLHTALVPAGDPTLRETTPATVSKLTLDEVKQFHDATVRPDLTTIVVIGDVTPDEARQTIEKWFGNWKATGPKPNTTLPPVPVNKTSAVERARCRRACRTR